MKTTFHPGDTFTYRNDLYLVVSARIMTRNDGLVFENVYARRWIKKTQKWSGNAYSYLGSALTKVEQPLDEEVGYNDYCSRL